MAPQMDNRRCRYLAALAAASVEFPQLAGIAPRGRQPGICAISDEDAAY